MAFFDLEDPLDLAEVGGARRERLWLRGGFPRSFLARAEADSAAWRRDLVATHLERELPGLGVTIPPATLGRVWSMLAHDHRQLWNGSELARAFGVGDTTVRRYLDLLTATFMVRRLPPWHEDLGKRQVKAPKIYLADGGLLHTLLGIATREHLERHPKVGASWEGFALEQVLRRLGARDGECFFWATHAGAELDLLVVRDGRRLGFEFKRGAPPRLTPSMTIARDDLRLDRLDVVYPGDVTYPLGERLRAVPLAPARGAGGP